MSKFCAQDSGTNPTAFSHHQKLSNSAVHHHLHQPPHHPQNHHHHRPKQLSSNHHPPQQYQAPAKYTSQNYIHSSKQTSSWHPFNPIQPHKQRMIVNCGNSSGKSFNTDSSIISRNDMMCHSINNLDDSSPDTLGPIIENEEELVDDEKFTENYLEQSTLFNSSWIFPEEYIIHNTPSRRHGISYDAEIEYRRKGTTFIRDLAKFLKMKPICKETAYVYFHRFYLLRSFKNFEPIRIAMACLYFACKYEDHPLCKDHLIQVSYLLVNNFVGKSTAHKLSKDEKEYIEYCDRLILDENCLLQVLGFELHVRHFQVLVVESYSKHLIPGATRELFAAAYQIASELNRLTTLCLEYDASTLAAVSICLAACYKSVTLPDDWCRNLMPDSKNHNYAQQLVLKISGQYRDILASSQLIRKMLSEEYLKLYGAPTNKCTRNKDVPKQLPNQLLLSNFSPDSAYSSSSSTAATYSPAEKMVAAVSVDKSGEIDNLLFQSNTTLLSGNDPSKCSTMSTMHAVNDKRFNSAILLNNHHHQQQTLSTAKHSHQSATLRQKQQQNYVKNNAVNAKNARCTYSSFSDNNNQKRVAVYPDDNDQQEQFQPYVLNDQYHLAAFGQQSQSSFHCHYKKLKSIQETNTPPPEHLGLRNDAGYYQQQQQQQQAAAQHIQQTLLMPQFHPQQSLVNPKSSSFSSSLYPAN